MRALRQVCRACPVRAQCAQHGLTEHIGTWGGLSERDRRHLRHGEIVTRAGDRWTLDRNTGEVTVVNGPTPRLTFDEARQLLLTLQPGTTTTSVA